MMSKTARHAVNAVVALAEHSEEGLQGTAALASRIGAPQNYLGKLLQTLARKGVVRSQKGLGGGFELAKPANTIRLVDIVEPIDHVSRWNGCPMGRSSCSEDAPCAMHDGWVKVRHAYLSMLQELTVADVLARSGGLPAAL